VIGYQEEWHIIRNTAGKRVNVRQVNALLKGLPDYTMLYSREVTPIAYRTKTFTELDSGRIQVQKKSDPDSDSNRWMSWVKLKHKETGKEFFFINVHMNNDDEGKNNSKLMAKGRSRGYDRFLAAWKKINPGNEVPTVMVGDFNAGSNATKPPFNDHYTKLGAAGWEDAALVAEKKIEPVKGIASYGGWGKEICGNFYYRAIRYGRRIDYIWVSGGAIAKTYQVYTGKKVVRKKICGKNVPFTTESIIPSDHWPSVSKIQVK
jgi:endonuclease/exonuclease/phosphatase family metal-dependent hydrolase